MKAQIFVYPMADLPEFNTGATTITSDLKSLLEDKQISAYLPFLPMYNAAQVMHSQVEYLEFKNGKGVRFLTQYDQALLPVNNCARSIHRNEIIIKWSITKMIDHFSIF